MYCEKCGTKNEDNAKFCEECGAVLEEKEVSYSGANKAGISSSETFVASKLDDDVITKSFNVSESVTIEKKPMSKTSKIIIIAAGILIILCVALYSVGKVLTAPDKIVEKYFKNISSGNYTEAYEYMDIESGEFTTKDMFVKVMQNQDNETDSDILNYTIKKNIAKTPLMKEYSVTYTQKGCSNTSVMDITLMKQSSKKWLFYDDYKIAENGLIAKNYSVTIPCGAEIYIDGIKVNESYADENEKVGSSIIQEKNYTIPSIFVGTHKIKVSAPFANDKTFDKNIEDGDCIDVYSVEVTDTAKEEVSKVAEDFLKDVVAAAIDKKPLDELHAYLSVNADMENIEQNYDNLKDRSINDEGTGIKSIKFNKFQSTASKEYQSELSYGVSVNYEYEYTVLKKDWYYETIEEYTPERSQNGNATVYCVYEDGKWMVTDFYINLYVYY